MTGGVDVCTTLYGTKSVHLDVKEAIPNALFIALKKENDEVTGQTKVYRTMLFLGFQKAFIGHSLLHPAFRIAIYQWLQ